jgi:hypothetical protein
VKPHARAIDRIELPGRLTNRTLVPRETIAVSVRVCMVKGNESWCGHVETYPA